MNKETTRQGVVFNIQRFSTHDGPGVRTVVFLQGCPLRCRWCQNPESQSFAPVLMQRQELCTGCGDCESVCPHGAARLSDAVSVIDRSVCKACGACARVCRAQALSLSGRTVTVDEVMTQVLRDRSYYQNSGGGMTLSGGEATAQPEFAIALLEAARGKYINTAVETCGLAAEAVFKRMIPLTNLFLYDIKAVDEEKHRAGTGHGNAQIKRNARLLAEAGCAIKIRMPLIPSYNDSEKDVLELRHFAEDELGLDPRCIELLRYNELGEVKFARLGRNDGIHVRTQSDEYFMKLQKLLH